MVNAAVKRPRPRSFVIAVAAVVALFSLIASAMYAKAAECVEPFAPDGLRASINSDNPSTGATLFAEDAVVIQPRLGGLPQIYLGRGQIRFWLRALASQHAHLAPRTAAAETGSRARWSDTLAIDAFQQLGVESAEVVSEAVLNGDRQIESLTSFFSPQAARRLSVGRERLAERSGPVVVDVKVPIDAEN